MGFLDEVRYRVAAAILPSSQKSYSTSGLLSLLSTSPPNWSKWMVEKAISEGYYQNVWVNRCVGLKATAAASIPWTVERKNGNIWEAEDDHEASMLLAQPNPYMSRQHFVELLFIFLQLAGEAAAKKVLVGGSANPRVKELWPIDTRYLIPECDEKLGAFVTHYTRKYPNSSKEERLELDEVLRFILPDPGDFKRGQSLMRSVLRQSDMFLESLDYGMKAMENRGALDSMLTPQGAGITVEQGDELRDLIRKQSNDRERILALNIPMKHDRIAMTPAEMEVGDAASRIADEICIGFGIDPALWKATTFRNKEHSRRALWEDTLVPELDRARSAFNQSLIPHYGEPEDLRVNYDITSVPALKEDLDSKVNAFVELVRAGVPRNMAAERVDLGLDEIPGGDVPTPDPDLSTREERGEMAGRRLKQISTSSDSAKAQIDINEQILVVADQTAEDLGEALSAQWSDLRGDVDLKAVEAALEDRSIDRAIAAFPWVAFAIGTKTTLTEYLFKLWEQVVELAAEMIEVETGREWTPTSPPLSAIKDPAERTANLMGDSSRKSLELMAEEGLETYGMGAGALAFVMVEAFGTNSNQARTVLKVLRNSGTESAGAAAELARRRFAGKMIERAIAAAQAEALSTASAARQQTFWQAFNEGHIGRSVRTWLTAGDGRVCPICMSLAGQTVKMEERYFSAYTGRHYARPGPGVDGVHGDCRCYEIITEL